MTAHNVPELGGRAASFSAQLSNALEARQLYVVLNNVQARQSSGASYAAYLNVPKGTTPAPDDPGYVGTLNFFGLHGGEHAGHDGGITVVFPATDVLKAISQRATNEPTVTLVPDGAYIPEAEPKIGSISLVSRLP